MLICSWNRFTTCVSVCRYVCIYNMYVFLSHFRSHENGVVTCSNVQLVVTESLKYNWNIPQSFYCFEKAVLLLKENNSIA